MEVTSSSDQRDIKVTSPRTQSLRSNRPIQSIARLSFHHNQIMKELLNMKNADRYFILKKTTELLGNMTLDTADQRSKGLSLDVSLEMTYEIAKQELLIHIKKQVSQIKTIEELTQSLLDSCYGFGALGMHQDLLRIKLVGADKTGQEALLDAIRKDTNEDNSGNWLACPRFEPDFEPREASNLVQEAFDNNCHSLCPDDTDDKALAFLYLLDRLKDWKCNLDLTPAAQDYQYFTCLKVVLGSNWVTRPLAGYFNDSGDYVMQGVDTEFISIFANKLRELLAQAGSKRAEHFKAMQIKQYLQEQIIQAFAGNNSSRPLLVYAEIERLIAASESPNGIGQQDYEDAINSNRFAVCRRYSVQGITYELNTEGFKTLAELLEILDLSGLQEVNVIINKIRAICA